jgi:hypothetical protein
MCSSNSNCGWSGWRRGEVADAAGSGVSDGAEQLGDGALDRFGLLWVGGEANDL